MGLEMFQKTPWYGFNEGHRSQMAISLLQHSNHKQLHNASSLWLKGKTGMVQQPFKLLRNRHLSPSSYWRCWFGFAIFQRHSSGFVWYCVQAWCWQMGPRRLNMLRSIHEGGSEGIFGGDSSRLGLQELISSRARHRYGVKRGITLLHMDIFQII